MANFYEKHCYKVQCSYDATHIFEIFLDIEKGSENKETIIEKFCPYCDEDRMVEITVDGRVIGEEIVRKIAKDLPGLI